MSRRLRPGRRRGRHVLESAPPPASVPTTRPRTERPALTNTYDALPRYAPISSLGGTFSPAEGSCPAASGPAWLCPPPRGASHKKVQRACAGLPLDVTPTARDAPLSTRVAGTGRFEQRRRTRTQHTHTHTAVDSQREATRRSARFRPALRTAPHRVRDCRRAQGAFGTSRCPAYPVSTRCRRPVLPPSAERRTRHQAKPTTSPRPGSR